MGHDEKEDVPREERRAVGGLEASVSRRWCFERGRSKEAREIVGAADEATLAAGADVLLFGFE
jgi:hypothetical protein